MSERNIKLTRLFVTLDKKPVASLSYAGRQITIIKDGKAVGRLFPAGYLEGNLDDGGLMDAYTSLHPSVHTPSDKLVASGLTPAAAAERLLYPAVE